MEVAGLAEIEGELRAAGAVFRVGVFIMPAGVVEESEEADDFLIGGVMAGEVEAVAADGEPVGRAVVGMRTEPELGGDEIPEREFGGREHGKMKSVEPPRREGRKGAWRKSDEWRKLVSDEVCHTDAAAAAFAGGDELFGYEGVFHLIVGGLVPAEGGAEGLVSGAAAMGAEGIEEGGLGVASGRSGAGRRTRRWGIVRIRGGWRVWL